MKRIKKTFFLTLFVTLISVTLIPNTGLSDNLFNGFNVSKSLIPQEEIIKGGPPRDGIPAILYPKFEEGEKVRWLRENDIITGIDFNGTQKAYPFKILVWHEAVNDEIDEIPILVSYCPLCSSTIVFRRDFWKKTLTFGISGLLYQSNVLFYDHQTESLWSQLEMKAVTGEMIGTELIVFPSVIATWKEWKTRYPKTLVLSKDTGFIRNYSRDPYSGYGQSPSIPFPVKYQSNRFHPKEKVLVIVSGSKAKAYPLSDLDKLKSPIEDKVGGNDVIITFSKERDFVEARDRDGKHLEYFISYWFAWFTFRPDTEVFRK